MKKYQQFFLSKFIVPFLTFNLKKLKIIGHLKVKTKSVDTIKYTSNGILK